MNISGKKNRLQKILILTILVAIGLILFSLETLLPQPIPGGKIGLSQLVTLLTLVWFGWAEALVVVLLRVILGNLLLGTLFNPLFLLACGGALVALFAMAVTYSRTKKFSVIGISVIGAFFHNSTQLLLAYVFFIRSVSIFWLFPYFILISVISGLFIGFITWFFLQRIF